jgi:hypothetical protein
MEDRRKSAEKINDIQGKVQEIFFDLEVFKENDVGHIALSKCLELMDEVAKIRNRVLKAGIVNNSELKVQA